MATPKEGTIHTLETSEQNLEERDEREVYLSHGRTLAIASEGRDEVLEIRASSGSVELRVKLTEEGPVLQLEGVRLSVKAAETVEFECKRFRVEASESVEVQTKGELDVKAEGDLKIESDKHVKVVGEMIYLN